MRTGITVLRKAVHVICRLSVKYGGLFTTNPDVPASVKSALLALVAACQASGFDTHS